MRRHQGSIQSINVIVAEFEDHHFVFRQLMEDCLVLSVLKGDLQSCLDLLCDGADPNLVSPTGAPLLHLALGVEEESLALALVQVLLVHGADSNPVDRVTGLTALQVATQAGRPELVALLKSFGPSQEEEVSSEPRGEAEGEGEVVRRFNKYIFDTEERPGRLNNNGAKFLQQVADLFEENIRGVKSDDSKKTNKVTEDISQLVSELDKIGFNATGLGKPSRLKIPPATVCSTPRATQKLPSLEVSNISSINAEETFYSFLPDQTGDSHITISEEYVIHDR